jgi:hypothetical protein
MNKLTVIFCFAITLAGELCSPAHSSVASSAVDLDCPKHLKIDIGQQLDIRCQIKNRSDDEVYILADDLLLEGPTKGEPYLFVPTGWERFENVLQYNFLSTGLDMPTLFSSNCSSWI